MVKLRLRSFKVHEWPEADRRLWAAAKQPSEDVDDSGTAAEWSAATIFNCEYFYGQYLRYLAIEGKLDPIATPLDRATMVLIREFEKAYSEGHAESSTAQVLLCIAMLVRACHPPSGNRVLTTYACRRQDRAKPALPKMTRMATIAELSDLGEHLMDEGREGLKIGINSAAIGFRDGLMISMLTDHPMRRKNFAALQIGHTLFVEGDQVAVKIPGDETKNAWEIIRVYRPRMADWIREYRDNARSTLLLRSNDPDKGFLWLGREGQPVGAWMIARIVKKHTLDYLGRGVPPHLFRNSVATDIAVNDPGIVGIARVVLGHQTYDTTQKYYILAETSSSFKRYEDALAKRKGSYPVRDLLK